MENNSTTAENLVFEMDGKICLIGAKIDALNHIKNVLGTIAEDAENKIHSNAQMFFLHDNNDELQLVDGLMFRLMDELNEVFRQAHEIQSQLFQLLKGGEDAINTTNRNVSHDYPLAQVKRMSDEDQKKLALASNHRLFEEENGRKATSDKEAINFTRNYVDNIIAKK